MCGCACVGGCLFFCAEKHNCGTQQQPFRHRQRPCPNQLHFFYHNQFSYLFHGQHPVSWQSSKFATPDCSETSRTWHYATNENTKNLVNCDAWRDHSTKQSEDNFPDGYNATQNHCFNPDQDKGGVWCYCSGCTKGSNPDTYDHCQKRPSCAGLLRLVKRSKLG